MPYASNKKRESKKGDKTKDYPRKEHSLKYGKVAVDKAETGQSLTRGLAKNARKPEEGQTRNKRQPKMNRNRWKARLLRACNHARKP